MRFTILLIIIFVAPTFCSAQTTWYVPDDFPTIQGAITGSSDGDTIIVRSGTYFENINFEGKAVTLKSQSGSDATIIDGNKSGSVVTFANTEGADSVLDGFLITNGSGTSMWDHLNGGGLFVSFSDPTVINCQIVGNKADSGAGMLNSHSKPTVTNCIFQDNIIEWNVAFYKDGGGMANYNSNPEVTYCTFRENSAFYGGGMSIYDNSDATVAYCYFIENYSGYNGGGLISQDNSTATVSYCTFTRNIGAKGGGMFNYNSKINVSNCIFIENEGYAWQGGGIYNSSCAPEVLNCTFVGNSAEEGGGIHNWRNAETIVTNCTFVSNESIKGGAMYNYKVASPIVKNCTFSKNIADEGAGIFNEMESIPTLTNCILWGNAPNEIVSKIGSFPSVTFTCIQGGYPGEGNIDSDPLFTDQTNDDYHLTYLSPCINRGTNDGSPLEDKDGDPRPFMGTSDMGMDEYVGGHTLATHKFKISQLVGGSASFALLAGPAHGMQWYCLFGTLSGTAPGQPLPGGLATLPINFDGFTNVIINLLNTTYFIDFLGVLDDFGRGTATLKLRPGTIPAILIGSKMQFAFTVDTFDFSSNPIEIVIIS